MSDESKQENVHKERGPQKKNIKNILIKKTYREKRKKTLNEVKPIPNIKGNHVNLNRKSHVERKSFLHLKQL